MADEINVWVGSFMVLAQHNDHLDSNADWLLDQGSKITANHVVTTSGIYSAASIAQLFF